jgi:hypothetical protein
MGERSVLPSRTCRIRQYDGKGAGGPPLPTAPEVA